MKPIVEPSTLNLHGIAIPRDSLRQHLLITGTTGSGKTRGVIRPLLEQLLSRGDATVLFDVKGDLLAIVQDALARCGRSQDLVTLGIGNHDLTFNPLSDRTLSPHQIVNQLLAATSMTGQELSQRSRSEEMFWATARVELLCSMVELSQRIVADEGDQQPLTFDHLQKLRGLLAQPSSKLQAWAADAAELLSGSGAAGLIEFAAYPETTRACILGSATNLIAPFSRPPLSLLVNPTSARPSLALPDLINHSKVVVVTAAHAEHAADLWPGFLLLKLALYRMVLSRPRLDVRQDNELVVVLDEYNRMILPHESLAGEHVVMEAARAARTSFILAAQNLSGLEAIGGNVIVDKIAALCSTFVFLSNNCPATARLAQRVLGNRKTFHSHRTVKPFVPPPLLFPLDNPQPERTVVGTVLVPVEEPVLSAAEMARLKPGAAHLKLADGTVHQIHCTFG